MTCRIAVLALLALAGAPLAQLLAADAPLQSFAEQAPPPAPDYAKPDNWAARPGRPGAAGALPPGATPAARAARVDVFYVHPTTYRSKVRWNQDIADAETNGWTEASVIARQASAFNACCRVFAPRYRQASSRAFAATLAGNAEGNQAYDLAYRDVAAAFAHYLAHDNHGRPFILAGHSQGGSHVARLIEERIDGTPLARRMVAAYVLGYNLSEGDFGRTFRTVTPCATAAQTGCIVQWNSVLASAALLATAAGGEQRFVARYGDVPGRTQLCVNPLTFDRAHAAAGAEAARGAVPGDPGYGSIAPLRAGAVAAHCDHGLLVVEPTPELALKPLPGGSMHFHDVGLFYADVRANALLRADAFLKRTR